jgi:hypothetical protein
VKRYLFIAVAVAVGVGAGVSYAAIPDSNGVIHGCYWVNTPRSPGQAGALRIIDPSKGQRCRASEAAVSWNKTGVQGPSGPSGPSGPKGNTGPGGSPGPSGVNSPLVFGPYTNPSDADSGVCPDNNTDGNPGWATDTLSYTYVVSPQSDGSFDVTKMFKGTFVTTGSSSPNDCGVSLAAGIHGTMYGDEVFTIPAQDTTVPVRSAAFDPMATCTSLCTGDDFVSAFFPGSTFPDNYSWQFDYATAHSQWTNADYGNSGNITS